MDIQYDLVIVGGTAAGLSVAISARRSGIDSVRIVEPLDHVAFPELVAPNLLDIGYGEAPVSIDVVPGTDELQITTDHRSYRARGCFVAQRVSDPNWVADIPIPDNDRVHVDVIPDDVAEKDVLIIGHTDNAVELVATAAFADAHVVYAAGGMDPGKLSPAGEHMLRKLEKERRATVLYRAVPSHIIDLDGFPIAYFDDRRTPDLEFDHVVFASTRFQPKEIRGRVSDAALATGKVIFIGRPTEDPTVPTCSGFNAGNVVAEAVFPELEVAPAPILKLRTRHTGVVEELREEHYNATITRFEPAHSDLWVLRVKPDQGDTSFLPGQYASLGLGFWEERNDAAVDDHLDDRWFKLIRRSYSISHPIFDENGYLARRAGANELEFYIVLVPPTADNVPALTPRLALKRPGDRIYLGPKVAGRYTLNSVIDPAAAVVFLSTGTGEAPHNAMVAELLSKGHYGPIVSAVTVRQWADLGYLEKHRILVERYSNYHYMPMPTREPNVPKRYLQDLIRDADISKAVGGWLDPDNTHVFLCGNPAMIGLQEEHDGELHWPEPAGVVELLSDRGFTIDKRGAPGNIHFEEYW